MAQRISYPSGGSLTRNARDAASNPALQTLARVGFAAKGFVFAVVGVLAMRAAFGLGSGATGEQGALRSLVNEPFGRLLVGALGVGLAAFALWRFIEMLAFPIRPAHRTADVLKHFGSLFSGLAYTSLAIAAFDLFSGRAAEGGGPQGIVGRVLTQPFGQALVIVGGLAAFAYGAYQIYYGIKENFLRKLDRGSMSARQLQWSRRLGKIGLPARGIVLMISGVFLFIAGMTSEASRAKGLEGIFGYLGTLPGSTVLIFFMGLGLLAYGAFCFFDARYRRLLAM